MLQLASRSHALACGHVHSCRPGPVYSPGRPPSSGSHEWSLGIIQCAGQMPAPPSGSMAETQSRKPAPPPTLHSTLSRDVTPPENDTETGTIDDRSAAGDASSRPPQVANK